MDPQHAPDPAPDQAPALDTARATRILAVRQPNMESSHGPAKLQKHGSAIVPTAEKENAPGDEEILGASGVFRLAPHPDARLEGNRVALKRGAFLRKRWEGGPQWKGVEAAGETEPLIDMHRNCDGCTLSGWHCYQTQQKGEEAAGRPQPLQHPD